MKKLKERLHWDKRNQGDFLIVILTTILVIFGVIMVFSASYYRSINIDGTPYTYLKKEIFFAIVGAFLMYLAAHIDYHNYYRFSFPFLVLGFALLVLVLFIGTEVGGAVRWIPIGPITIMPGEIAKVCAIFFVAGWFSNDPKRILSFRHGIVPMVALIVVYCGLIMKQPNLSTALTVAFIISGIMFVAGLQYRWIGVAAGVAGVGILALRMSETFWATRIEAWLHPFKYAASSGYQIVQSLLALGTGGLFGLGLGKSVQKNLYLPEPQNDYILAIVGEELGFLGVAILLTVFVLLIWRGFLVAVHAPDFYGMLLASGVTLMIGIQVVLNVAVVTNSMPPTGIALPFISYGGNALWIFMFCSGLLLNISHQSKEGVSEEVKYQGMSRVERVRARNEREGYL